MSKEVRTGGSAVQQQLTGLEWHLLQWKRLPAGSQSDPNPACFCKGAHEQSRHPHKFSAHEWHQVSGPTAQVTTSGSKLAKTLPSLTTKPNHHILRL